MDRSNS